MIQKDFTKLLELFALEREGASLNLEESLKAVSSFLDALRTSYKEANEMEKIDLYEILGAISQDTAIELKKAEEKFKIDEEEVVSLCENPANFTQREWLIVQEIRKKIGSIDQTSQQKEAPKQKPPKKDKWMRS